MGILLAADAALCIAMPHHANPDQRLAAAFRRVSGRTLSRDVLPACAASRA